MPNKDEKKTASGNKKVLILAPQPFFVERGTPINVREILFSLSKAGYKISLLSYDLGKDLEIEHVKIERSYRPFFIKKISAGPSVNKIILDIFFFFKALRLVIKNNYSKGTSSLLMTHHKV